MRHPKHIIYHGNWRKKKLKSLTSEQAAYIAGIIDGEGAVAISRKKDPTMRRGYAYRVYIEIVNTDLKLVRWLRRTCGLGSVKKSWCAKPWYKPALRWSLWSIEAYQLLRRVFPYLRVKSKRASLCMRLIEAKNDGVGRFGLSLSEWKFQERIYDAMKKLNVRGTKV